MQINHTSVNQNNNYTLGYLNFAVFSRLLPVLSLIAVKKQTNILIVLSGAKLDVDITIYTRFTDTIEMHKNLKKYRLPTVTC